MSDYNDHGDEELARLYEELEAAQTEADDEESMADAFQAELDEMDVDDPNYERMEDLQIAAYNEFIRLDWEVSSLWREIELRKKELGIAE